MRKNKWVNVFFISVISIITIFGYLVCFHPVVRAASSMSSSSTANLKVIDISQYNDMVTTDKDDINFDVLRTQVNAVYIRSFNHTNSVLSIDTQAVRYAQSAQKVNLKYGFYFYYIPTSDPADARSQAGLFYSFVKDFDYSCVPVLDVENNDNNLSKAQLSAAVKTFADEFKALSGFDVMVYTFPYFVLNNFDTAFNWNAYKLWIANYNVAAPMADISSTWMPESLWCWSSWDMWQYTSKGTLSAVPSSTSGYLDMNIATDNIYLSAVSYQSHIQDIGWQEWVSNAEVSGTSGKSKQMEAVRIVLENVDGGIEYRTQVQDIGWMSWVANGELSGTSAQHKRMEAIQISLSGAAADVYDVYYRVHAQNVGWFDWTKNGDSAGTAGYGYRLEAIQIKLVPKGEAAPGSTARPYADYYATPIVNYQTHVQKVGWQKYVNNGATSGTVGQSKRLEAISLVLQHVTGGIEYRTHVQGIGWMDWVADGRMSGTSGQSKRLEAIQIRLTGAAADQYDIYYRVHAQNNGWMDWAKNGESAGTAGYGYRLEAIQVVIVAKGQAAPGPTARPFAQA